MLTVFITSNQIPLHVHAVFCQLHVHCIPLARGMMRMRIPSNYYSGISGIIIMSPKKHNETSRPVLLSMI